MPSSMSRMHGNYSWASKTVPASTVCDRGKACSVSNRPYSNIAKVCSFFCAIIVPALLPLIHPPSQKKNKHQVDRTGQLVQCGPTPMEAAVMLAGGRTPDNVAAVLGVSTPSSSATSLGYSAISARYIQAAAAQAATRSVAGGGAPSASVVLSGAAAGAAGSSSSSASNNDGMYTYMDEEYLRCMQSHIGWERDNGIIHLMPIAVVYQEDLS